VAASITVDPIRQQIFWVDWSDGCFYSSSLDGSNVTKIYDSNLEAVEALSVYGKRCSWNSIGIG